MYKLQLQVQYCINKGKCVPCLYVEGLCNECKWIIEDENDLKGSGTIYDEKIYKIYKIAMTLSPNSFVKYTLESTFVGEERYKDWQEKVETLINPL